MSLKVEKLIRHYPGNKEPTLKGLSFELEAGTLTALLGRSGAGKSTVLRCVMGLEPFEEGTIDVDGVQVKGTRQSTPKERALALVQARAKLGLVFQAYELFPHLSVLENCVLAPMKVRQEPRARAEARAVELLEQLGLGERINAWPEQLSGGQKQRVAIARALCMEPRVLLYDEPTSALDPSLKAEVLHALQRVDQTGVTQVVVTHDMQLAKGVERVCVLDSGLVVEEGAPGKVLATPEHESTRKLLASWLEESSPPKA